MSKGKRALINDDRNSAIGYFNEATRRDPKNSDAWSWLAVTMFSTAWGYEGRFFARRAFSLARDNRLAVLALALYDGFFVDGDVYAELKSLRLKNPDDLFARLCDVLIIDLAQGGHRELNKLLQEHPEYEAGWVALACALERTERGRPFTVKGSLPVVEAALRALEQNPQNIPAVRLLGAALPVLPENIRCLMETYGRDKCPIFTDYITAMSFDSLDPLSRQELHLSADGCPPR